jgi:hypothetical protein
MKQTFFQLHNLLLTLFIYITYSLILISILGLSDKGSEYLNTLDTYMKIYVSIFLIIRFNPFTKNEFNDLDRRFAFTSGMFILTTSAIAQVGKKYIKSFISDI